MIDFCLSVILLALTLIGCGSSDSPQSPVAPPPAEPSAVVDFGSAQQTIRGFAHAQDPQMRAALKKYESRMGELKTQVRNHR